MSETPEKKDIDPVTGVETTGHEWDGIRELNNPLPKWWIYVWVASIVWSIGYYILMPSWPVPGKDGWTYTPGLLNHSSREAAMKEIAEAEAGRASMRADIAKMPFEAIRKDEKLMAVAIASGRTIFGDNCAPCHGAGGQGGPGYPSLVDDDWLWGGSLEEIQKTITHGIRSPEDPDTHFSEMPNFLADGMMTAAQGQDVVQYVLSLSNRATGRAAARRGAPLFAENCASCHGADGRGDKTVGAPNLADHIWLYGGTEADIGKSMTTSHKGVMPAWNKRLSPGQIKEVTLYLASLGAR